MKQNKGNNKEDSGLIVQLWLLEERFRILITVQEEQLTFLDTDIQRNLFQETFYLPV